MTPGEAWVTLAELGPLQDGSLNLTSGNCAKSPLFEFCNFSSRALSSPALPMGGHRRDSQFTHPNRVPPLLHVPCGAFVALSWISLHIL